jgi:hypothetical protein
MANRTSSITAELHLSGQAKFRSGLRSAADDARKLGEALSSAVPAPDIAKTQAFQDVQYRKKNAENLTKYLEEQEKKRADVAIRENNRVALAQRRIQMSGGGPGFGHLSGTMYQGGKMDASQAGPKGRSNAYGLGVAYNAVQDLVQGGPSAIANNIPQIIELVAKSPMLKVLGVAAAAAAAGYGAVKMAQYAYGATDAGNDETAARNYSKGRAEADARQAARRKQQGILSGQSESGAVTESLRIAGLGGEAEGRRFQDKEREIQLSDEAKMARIQEIEDPAERLKKAAAEEARVLEETNKRYIERTTESYKSAAAEQAAAEERKNALTEEIKLINEKSTKWVEADYTRRAFLEAQLPGATEDLNAARSKSEGAIANMGDANASVKAVEQQKKNIEDGLKAQLKAIDKEKELIEAEGRMNQHNEQVKYKIMRDQAMENIKEGEKDRQKTRDSLSSDEALSNMSPRKRAKAEKELRKAAEIEDLQKQGFSKKEATDMADRRMKLADDADPSKPKRIRGAGYGAKDPGMGGLGSATFGALDDLEAMQPAASKDRKTIKGAGAKEKKSGVNDKPDNLYQVMVKGFADVVKSIRDTGPNAAERAKPTSSIKG